MSYGFQLINDNDYLQIDDSYSNTYVIASGSQQASPTGVAITITPPAGFTDPYIFLIRSNSYNIPIWNYGPALYATATITVDIVLLGFSTTTATPQGYGFISYKSDGNVAFAFDRKTGSVQARRQLTSAESSAYTSAYSISIPNYPANNRKRYFSLNSCAIDYLQRTPYTGGLFGRKLCFYSDSMFLINACTRYTALPPYGMDIYESYPSQRQYLIVDF